MAGSANNQLATPADAERLRAILYAPDFVVKCGGAMYLLGRELLGWTEPEREAYIRGTAGNSVATSQRPRASPVTFSRIHEQGTDHPHGHHAAWLA